MLELGCHRFTDARELFRQAQGAARDAEKIGRQLAADEHRALGMSGGGFEPRVRSTPAYDRMGMAVAVMVDREAKLLEKQDEDYALMDLACALLYGTDQCDGLRTLVGWPADALYHHYLALRTWEETAALLGYSTSHVRNQANYALDYVDANGAMFTMLGIGMAT